MDEVVLCGGGVAPADGGNVYVPYTLGGETVEVAPVPGHPDRPRLLQVEPASPERITPVCPHLAICGRCASQHSVSEHYHACKRNLAPEQIAKAGPASAGVSV